MSMKERSWQSESYRYGFNGKENDTDWEVQDYGFRIYKSEISKFLSVDPLTQSYPWYTPYQFAGNKPIVFLDLDGAEEYHYLISINIDGSTQITLDRVEYLVEWRDHEDFPWLRRSVNARKAYFVHFKYEQPFVVDGIAGMMPVDKAIEVDGIEEALTIDIERFLPQELTFGEEFKQSFFTNLAGGNARAFKRGRSSLKFKGKVVEIHDGTTSTLQRTNADGKLQEVGKKSSSSTMIGANAASIRSKTIKQWGETERIDIENPSPGVRAGQLHYQDPNNVKYLYRDGKFYGEDPKKGGTFNVSAPHVDKLIKNKAGFKEAIDKGLKMLSGG